MKSFLTKCLLQARRLLLRAGTVLVSRFNHLVQLRDSGRVPVTKANAITAFKPEETGKNRNEATVR